MLKIKPLTKEQLIISIDRLTRFKHPEIKYLRVFKDILINNLISPKFKKTQLDNMEYSKLKDYAQEIINYSLKALNLTLDEDYAINQQLYDYEKSIFNIDKETEKLLKNKINYKAFLNLINEDSVINLHWLKTLPNSNQTETRKTNQLRFPVEKIIISEGITEEILLPEFAKICGYDFDSNGIYMLSAGGKNQVVKLFYQLSQATKLPIFILLDKDAQENYTQIKPKLRLCDKVHVLKCGEFEDALPINLVRKTLANEFKNISLLDETVNKDLGMVKTLEEIFRHRGLHEFKKADFAQAVKMNLTCISDISKEIQDIITEIKELNTNLKNIVDN